MISDGVDRLAFLPRKHFIMNPNHYSRQMSLSIESEFNLNFM